MVNLWQTLFEHAPHLFDTGSEHGPWLYGDTRQDHGPYPWMRDAFSYYRTLQVQSYAKALELQLLYGGGYNQTDKMVGLRSLVET